MTISLIAAMSSNRVIGSGGRLPWQIPEDLRRFRRLTSGHALIMGRKTHESIGRALPGRKNIVVTRRADYKAGGCLTAASLDEAIRLAEPDEEIFVCGGGELYRQAMPLADKIYLTVITGLYYGDTTFPEIPADEFTLLSSEKIADNPEAALNIYRRKPGRDGL